MSVETVSKMEKRMWKPMWTKYSYVCTDCDALVEITIRSNTAPNPECTEDGMLLTLIGWVDATVQEPVTNITSPQVVKINTNPYN